MALMKELGGLSTQLLRNKACLYATVRCFSDKPMPWNQLWMPKEYSEKDHDKIAEKYHMHPKDYKPTEHLGDYPKLPMIGPAAKDPYYPYDIPTFRKNYHEPIHENFEIMGEDRYSYGVRHRIDPYLASAIFVAVLLGGALITYLLEPYKSFIPRMEKQMPQRGAVHYSFEPTDS